MYTLRVAAFIISLLLAVGVIDPAPAWLIGLTVLTGISLLGSRFLVPPVYIRTRRWADDW